MTDPSADPVPGPRSGSAERLDSWKEIAAYLKRDVSTVQRWEKREGMPVHRHVHEKIGSVYAFRTELDAWAAGRKQRPGAEDPTGLADQPPPDVSTPSSRRAVLAASVAVLVVLAATALTLRRLQSVDYFWRNPLANARFQRLTDFAGAAEHSAAISRDGKLVAFLSSRAGQVDLFLTQVGSGQFHDLTHNRIPELVNRSVRTIEFSPDGARVSFWVGKSDASSRRIGIWVAPTLAGEPHPYLDDVAEINWSPDGRSLVYHTPAAGDPTFVKIGDGAARPIFTAPAPEHSHFPTWSPDGSFIYFVRGNVPDEMDIWRIRAGGGVAERITFNHSRVSHPTFIDASTLLYLATADDGSGPWIYAMNVNRRVPHRVSYGVEPYTSLAAGGDGTRLVATATHPRTSLWRVPVSAHPAEESEIRQIALPTAEGRLPRIATDYVLYVSSNGVTDGVWKLANGTATEVWTAPAARIIGAPAIAPVGGRVAFAIEDRGRTRLIVMNVDGTGARSVGGSLTFRGAPAWSPDGQSIVIAAVEAGKPQLYRIPLGPSAAVRLLDDYSLDPAWGPDGAFVVYSGMEVGTTFPVKSITPAGRPYTIPALNLSRGARRFRFLPGRAALVVLRGDVEYKNLWMVDLVTGAERQLTNFGRDLVIGDFDISPDGQEIVFERVQEESDIVLIELPPR